MVVGLSTSTAAESETVELRLEYIVYALEIEDDGTSVVYSVAKLHDPDGLEAFCDEHLDVDFDNLRSGEQAINSTDFAIIHLEEFVNGTWTPKMNASIRLSIVSYPDDSSDDPVVNPDGRTLMWEGISNENGTVYLDIWPAEVCLMMVYIPEVSITGETEWTVLDNAISPYRTSYSEKRISYVIYSTEETRNGTVLDIYHHTFDEDIEAVDFLRDEYEVTSDNWDAGRTLIRNETVMFSSVNERIDAYGSGGWIPNTDGEIELMILGMPDPSPYRPYIYGNGTSAVFQWQPDKKGKVSFELKIPEYLGNFQLRISANGGKFDPLDYLLEEATRELEVRPPHSIYISHIRLNPEYVEIGGIISVTGTVLYVYTDTPVYGAEVTISGRYLSTTVDLTDSNGRFQILLQGPILVGANFTMHIDVYYPYSRTSVEQELPFGVLPTDSEDENSDEGDVWIRPLSILIVVIFIGITFIGVTAYLLFYPRSPQPPHMP